MTKQDLPSPTPIALAPRGSRQKLYLDLVACHGCKPPVVGPELIAFGVQGSREVQRVWGLDAMVRSKIRGQVDDLTGQRHDPHLGPSKEAVVVREQYGIPCTHRLYAALEPSQLGDGNAQPGPLAMEEPVPKRTLRLGSTLT